MRLICPNCSAQYEIPDDVMPPEGRDVQCSNCGTTWFQDHPSTIAEREADQSPDATVETSPVQDDVEGSSQKPVEQDVSEEEQEAETVTLEVRSEPSEPAPVADLGPDPIPEETGEEPGRRQLDPDVADVLREEAERESAARQSEADVLESQPELGLAEVSDSAQKRSREAQDRMARMRAETQDTPPQEADSAGANSRKDLLPDIEEINSTLRSNNSRSPEADPGQTAQIEVKEKRSSRRGFVLTVALVAVMALVYAYAPQIAATVPSAEPALAGYVTMIDGWRVWVDTQLSSLLTWLDAAAVSSAQ